MSLANPTPKQTFRSIEGRVKRHADLIAKPALREALETAMLEYCRRQAATPDPGTGERIKGAHDFVSVFLGLAEEETSDRHYDPDNLQRE